MINPGFETNLPTSSGRVDSAVNLSDQALSFNLLGGSMGNKLFTIDGFTLTVGMLVIGVGLIIFYNMFLKRR